MWFDPYTHNLFDFASQSDGTVLLICYATPCYDYEFVIEDSRDLYGEPVYNMEGCIFGDTVFISTTKSGFVAGEIAVLGKSGRGHILSLFLSFSFQCIFSNCSSELLFNMLQHIRLQCTLVSINVFNI